MPVTYCWSHGTTSNLRHNSMTCMYKKDGHQDASTYSNKMGGCATRAGLRSWTGGSAATHNHVQNKLSSFVINNLSTRDSTASALPNTNIFKLDSGATSHFYDTYKSALLCQPVSSKNPTINVLIPNGDIMQSISTASLPIPDLPATATKAHGFPHLASGSLLSVGQLCDHQCTAVFTSTKANIYHNKDIQIIPKGQSILEGTRSAHDQLWSVQLVPPTHCPLQHNIKHSRPSYNLRYPTASHSIMPPYFRPFSPPGSKP